MCTLAGEVEQCSIIGWHAAQPVLLLTGTHSDKSVETRATRYFGHVKCFYNEYFCNDFEFI
jgi:hypothetical protein